MASNLLRQSLSSFKETLAGHLTKLHEIAVHTGNPELKQITSSLVTNLNMPFLFVVVGEVKSGKSSFINALLGKEVTAVAPDPCTDAILKIVYSPEPYEKNLREKVKEIGLPHEILKEISIVDTPGTNSIMEHHQEITERFIPLCDLGLFVFPALNPYAKTSWELFAKIHHEWHKKIIFILQQADRATEEELRVNTTSVAALARERGINTPRIFPVSAKKAQNDAQDSGMEAVTSFIRDAVTSGSHYFLKMESLLGSAETALDKVHAELRLWADELEVDKEQRETIEKTLQRGKENAQRELADLQLRLLLAYKKHADDLFAEFDEGLSVFNLARNTVKGVFSGKNSFQGWVEKLNAQFGEKLLRETELLAQTGETQVAGNIIRCMEGLMRELKHNQANPTLSAAGMDVSGLARQRLEVIAEVIVNLRRMTEDPNLSERVRPEGLKQIGDQAMLGGLITAIGAVIAAATHMVLFDVTGGVFAAMGALLAVNTLTFKRKKLLRTFREALAKGEEHFKAELDQRLTSQPEAIFRELRDIFHPYFENITEREDELNSLLTGIAELEGTFTLERAKLQDLSNDTLVV